MAEGRECVIGIDFGTLSGRAVVVRVQDGAELGSAAAADKSGDAEKARAHYNAAVTLSENADPVRPQIAQARAFVEKSAR